MVVVDFGFEVEVATFMVVPNDEGVVVVDFRFEVRVVAFWVVLTVVEWWWCGGCCSGGFCI